MQLITFRNSDYKATAHRFVQQVENCPFIASVSVKNEADIKPLMRKHRLHFAVRKKVGFGDWIWKPYIILEQLKSMPEGEVLIYSDLGNHWNPDGEPMMNDWVGRLSEEVGVGAFTAGDVYSPSQFVRREHVESYAPAFFDSPPPYVYAGLLFFRNSPAVRSLVADWLSLCQRFLAFPRPLFLWRRQRPEFAGTDGDNGLLPLVLFRYQNCVFFDGRLINLYSEEGLQQIHRLQWDDYKKLDWSSLRGSPVTYRRDR
jgi:hypothetical protein